MSKFVTCLNCMDGRTQLPLINWLMNEYKPDYVDQITEAGMDGFLMRHDPLPEALITKIDISLKKHGSDLICIVGHHDCGGHPVDEATHREHTVASVKKIKALRPDCRVIGVWVSEDWKVEKITEL